MSPKLLTPPRPRRKPDRRTGAPGAFPVRRPRRPSYRRALRLGLLGSALAHLLVLLLAGRMALERPSAPRLLPEREPEEGLLVILFRLAEPPPAEEPPRRPEEELEVVRPVPAREPAAPAELPVEAPAEEPEPERLTNVERLRPYMGDERLWVDFRSPITVHHSERYDRAVDALREIIREWLDSLQLSDEQRRRALDWTLGTGDSRWGISSEGLHLGEITIPIPFGQFFQQGGPRGREAEAALRELQEIQAQDLRQDVEEILRQRREEMRRRSQEEAERRKRGDTTTSGGGGR